MEIDGDIDQEACMYVCTRSIEMEKGSMHVR